MKKVVRSALVIIGALIIGAVILFGRLFPSKYVTPPQWL